MKSEWKKILLGEVADIKNGYAFKSKEFTADGVPVLKIKNIKPNKILLDSTDYVSEETAEKRAMCQIKKGNILLTMTGNRSDGSPESWVGKAALFNEDGRYLLNQRVAAITSKNKDVDTRFLGYYLSSWNSQLYFIKRANSSGGQANISPEIVKNMPVLLPSLVTQKKIAEMLDSINTKIAISQKINENLEQQAQALFSNWTDQNIGEYTFSPLSTVADINTATYSPKQAWDYVNYLDTSSITDGVISGIQCINPSTEKLPSRARRIIHPNDIVFSTVRPNQCHFGIIREPYDNMLASTGFAVIRSKLPSISNELIYLCLTEPTFIEKMQQLAEQSTSTFPSIKPSDLDNCEIPHPISKELKESLSAIFTAIASNMKESRRLSELRDTLLPKLMSGEIDVEGIEL